MARPMPLLLALLLTCAAAGPARAAEDDAKVEAQAKGKKKDRDRDEKARRKPPPKRDGPVAIPIDVGVGPMAIVPTGSVFFDQYVHSALTLSLAAVIDQDLIRRERDRIPAEYRRQAGTIGEARIRPLWLAVIPEVVIVSPAWLRTGMYGAIWRPFGLGVTLVDQDALKVGAHAAVDLAYVFVHSTSIPQPTHFLRPGLNADLVAELKITETFLVSGGWSSSFYPPQPVGRPPWELLPVQDSLWHLGGPFVKLHVRVPYETNL